MDSLVRDVRYSARKLLRTPGFTAIVVATMALAIGGTTAIFSIVNGVILKSLPFAEPDRLVQISSRSRDGKPTVMSYLDFADYRARARGFSSIAAYDPGTTNLTGVGEQPLRLATARVNANYFDLLGVKPVLGRMFARGEDAKGAARTAVLSEGMWRSRFGADRGIVGKNVNLNGHPTTVLGVAPATVNFPSRVDVWLPFIPSDDDTDPRNRGGHFLHAIGRLAPGITVEVASTELSNIARQLEVQFPESNTGFGAMARPLRELIVGDVERPLYIMFACVGFVLLIACANVANLLLVRASARETEIAVRTALGAGRGALVRQLLVESLLLSLGGAVVGVALASWAVDAAVAFAPRGLPRLDEISVNAWALLFAVGVAVVSGLLFGMAPALHVAGGNVGHLLKEGTRSKTGHRAAQRTRSILVVTEMALAVVLLVGAGLLVRSFINMMSVDLGYRPEHVVTLSAELPSVSHPWDAEQLQFVDRVLSRLHATPNVTDAAIAFGRPLQNGGIRNTFEVAGWPPSTPQKRHLADVRMVTPGFFHTLDIPVVAGRGILPSDGPSAVPVVVVSAAFVKEFFPTENPIGKRITLGWTRQRSADPKDTVTAGGTIVGVAGDIKARSLTEPPPSILYAPFAQFPFPELHILVRTAGAPTAAINAARAAVREAAPTIALYDVETMGDVISGEVAQPRFYTVLLTAFAAIALVIAALGIYGVISYSVSQRTRELGIRIALGATEPRVVQLVVGQGLRLTLLGVVVGLAGAYELTFVIKKLLFNVAPSDTATFVVVGVVLSAVALVASYLPARRAARVDPVAAMRSE